MGYDFCKNCRSEKPMKKEGDNLVCEDCGATKPANPFGVNTKAKS